MIVLRHLPAVIDLDAIAGRLESRKGLARASPLRRGDFLRRHLESNPIKIEPVEPQSIFLERLIAARSNIGDDGADRGLNIGRGFALGVQEGAKLLRKIGGAGVEADRHEINLMSPLTPISRSTL